MLGRPRRAAADEPEPETGDEEGEEEGRRMERSRWKGKAEEGGVSRGAQRRASAGGPWPRTFPGPLRQPPAPGAPSWASLPAAAAAAATSPSTLETARLHCPPAAPRWVLERRGRGKEGGRQGGERAGGREGGRQGE